MGEEGYGDRLAAELARVREALDDLRRRPMATDADTLRHVVTASLSEANAPPPNLLVTAIRRLDRVDSRLESIESLLGGGASPPRGGIGQAQGAGRARPPALGPPPSPATYAAPPPDAEAIADALARRLSSLLAAQAPVAPSSGAATVDDLIDALRPLVPEAARSVLRRAGREPSPQAVEVLQQTAMTALEQAAASLGPYAVPTSGYSAPPDPRRYAPAPALAPGPAPAPAPPPRSTPPAPPPLDVDALAAAVAARVSGSLAAEFRPAPAPVEQPAPRPEPEPLPPPPPPVDPAVVAEAVISRLAQQPPPQAVVSAMAMAPLLSAVGNVEAAVARLAEPDADVAGAVDRLEAGVGALARALEEDRSTQAEEVRRGFAEVSQLVRAELAAQITTDDRELVLLASDGGADAPEDGAGSGSDAEPAGRALVALQRRLDRLSAQLVPLSEADLAAVPDLAVQGQRLERSLGHILTALAAMAEHLQEQSATWRSGFDDIRAAMAAVTGGAASTGDVDGLRQDLARVASRVDDLVTGTGADRQRFQRLGGTIDGLAELLGEVSERLDRLPRVLEPGAPFPASAWQPGHVPPPPGGEGLAEHEGSEADPVVAEVEDVGRAAMADPVVPDGDVNDLAATADAPGEVAVEPLDVQPEGHPAEEADDPSLIPSSGGDAEAALDLPAEIFGGEDGAGELDRSASDGELASVAPASASIVADGQDPAATPLAEGAAAQSALADPEDEVEAEEGDGGEAAAAVAVEGSKAGGRRKRRRKRGSRRG